MQWLCAHREDERQRSESEKYTLGTLHGCLLRLPSQPTYQRRCLSSTRSLIESDDPKQRGVTTDPPVGLHGLGRNGRGGVSSSNTSLSVSKPIIATSISSSIDLERRTRRPLRARRAQTARGSGRSTSPDVRAVPCSYRATTARGRTVRGRVASRRAHRDTAAAPRRIRRDPLDRASRRRR